MRQRLRTRSSRVSFLGRIVLVAFLLVALWYGLMTILLALGVPRGPIDLISGYRTAYDLLAGLGPDSLTPRVRLVAGLSGLGAFLVFAYLAYKEVPRPYVARRRLGLAEDERGEVTVAPRAIERVAESAAFGNPGVTKAAGRWEGEDLNLDVHLDRARDLPATLRDVQGKVAEALATHGLPAVPVGVTLTGFDNPRQQRELS
ncbi:MAG: hypothetical protein H0V55_02680 [Thermoleophilaceae bacterium]|jgi:hypothetical protein|nr:hypothetical protein [Thermoleophilaceae bacterium]